MKLKAWVKNLPTPIRVFLGIIVGLLCWLLVVVIILMSNTIDSIKYFFHETLCEFKMENRTFVDFFKSLLRTKNENTA